MSEERITEEKKQPESQPTKPAVPVPPAERPAQRLKEIGGQEGPDPTRYGDWEKNGRVSDF
jgi:hypothetical protein